MTITQLTYHVTACGGIPHTSMKGHNMKKYLLITSAFLVLLSAVSAEEGKHLFILSGQSNMRGLDPSLSFTPTVEERFGKENVIVVHDAHGGENIWKWLLPEGHDQLHTIADKRTKKKIQKRLRKNLYLELMKKVKPAIEGQTLKTVTLCWMQGERDANVKVNNQKYGEHLAMLLDQIRKDTNHQDLNLVIGRLSDFGTKNGRGRTKYTNWPVIRKAQEDFAKTSDRFEWVNTDDLNELPTSKNDLHYSEEGYVTFGKRLSETAIKIIDKHQ